MQGMNYILFDGTARDRLLPFTFTRPVAEIRIGILTIREKWERLLGSACGWHTVPYLREKFPFSPASLNTFINASFLPTEKLAEEIAALQPGESLVKENELLAACLEEEAALRFPDAGEVPGRPSFLSAEPTSIEMPPSSTEVQFLSVPGKRRREWSADLAQLVFPEDIFRLNGLALEADFRLLTTGRVSAAVSSSNRVAGGALFVGEGVEMECVNVNTTTGPVYLGRNAVIMEGTNLRGPLAVCEGAVVKMGARIYGPTTIGPGSVVGGELKQSVIFGNSNKSHDGYLGNSVVGEWCNFGAGTDCSNMKNNYRTVKLRDYGSDTLRDTGLDYCGLMMGDFSRTGIGTRFNTGTTVGVSAHFFGSGLSPVFVPDFNWGNGMPPQTYRLKAALEAAASAMERKGRIFGEKEVRIVEEVFRLTRRYRGDDPGAVRDQ